MKWVSRKEVITAVTRSGYDEDLAYWVPSSFGSRHCTYQYLQHYYYMHKEQLRRNKAKELARLEAEKLVGTQTPPQQEGA